MSNDLYRARSASDRTDDWPFWLVADRYGVNRTREAAELAGVSDLPGGAVLVLRGVAEWIAGEANKAKGIASA